MDRRVRGCLRSVGNKSVLFCVLMDYKVTVYLFLIVYFLMIHRDQSSFSQFRCEWVTPNFDFR